jgi:superfamily II DNA or RNA helicase
MERLGVHQILPLGSVVRFRDRNWVLLEREEDRLVLRPLAGGDGAVLAVHPLLSERLSFFLPQEALTLSQFEPPKPELRAKNHQDLALFQQAARLLLREGVAPFRSLGKVSVRPRPYQLVPLLMALRLDPVRLLIADDVGVGKTIEAGLILRELLEAKEARRVAVLAPPHLMEQWTRELAEKFALEPTPISPATLGRLERGLPHGRSVYAHYPVQVVSIDFVKHPRHRTLFLQDAPDLVVVDEAHGVVGGVQAEGHLRYELVQRLAEDPRRHLLLLTATPHSGIPEAFQRLLGLLDPGFAAWDLEALTEEKRDRLARHFVQRTRKDVLQTWKGERLFPEREVRHEAYALSEAYRRLYEAAYRYATELVRSGEGLEEARRRMRWWAALALLRAVMSSPQAAQAALERRGASLEEVDPGAYAPQVYEATDLLPDDEVPRSLLALAAEGRSLRDLRRLAKEVTPEEDAKLQGVLRLVGELLEAGHAPVVWCHYVDTAAYVGEALRRAFPEAAVEVVTGRMDGELRRQAIEELMDKPRRVLVATDCVSEGVNLQRGFSACIHYDLPWNPNRLEQREGRVDRYGQPKEKVVVVRYRGRDNPVDEAVVEVLLRKAETIRRSLGIYVPVPQEEAYVVDRMVRRLFYQGVQAPLFPFGEDAERAWELDAERERVSRTRFAQRALRPEEVMEVLEETDAVLGDPEAVRTFVLLALQRLGVAYRPLSEKVYEVLALAARQSPTLPDAVRRALPAREAWRVAFHDPAPEGVEFLGRNHPLVAALARYAFEGALLGRDGLGRWAAFRVKGVERTTYLYLLRPRYLLTLGREVLGEEVLVLGQRGGAWLEPRAALPLLDLPPEADVPEAEAKEHLERALRLYEEGREEAWALLGARAEEIQKAHRRVRQAVRLRVGGVGVRPVGADLLGVRVLLPHRG